MLEETGGLIFAGGKSFTPWELYLRQLIFRMTSGRKGGATYHYEKENAIAPNSRYRFFSARLAMNRIWFNLSCRTTLDGEMMFIHMIKKECNHIER